MRKIRIVSDSSSDVLTLKGVDFASAPLKIITDGREFTDDASLDVKEMTEYFKHYKGKSKTSCPNASDWFEAFGDADEVFCVTITSGLSGSYNSALAAARIYESEHAGRRVFVLDSLSAGPEITLLVFKLAEYVRAGMSFEEICDAIKEYHKKTGLFFMLKSLKNFASNGRVSPAVAKIAGLLGICIVGKASDEGTLEPSHKCRSESNSLETIVTDLEQAGLKNGRVCIAHNDNKAAALTLCRMLKEKFPEIKTEVHRLRGLCSYYAETGGVLVGFEKM